MKTLGLIGGMSWESTATYYRLLNEGVKERLGGLHSAKILLASFDFAEIAAMQTSSDWAGLARIMVEAAQALERAGAEALLICTNTMHKLAPEVTESVAIPLLHVVDATAEAIKAADSRRPALLATRFTMEQDFYISRLKALHGIEPIIPDEEGRAVAHRIIFEELCRGIVTPESKRAYLDIVQTLERRGADGVIFGCTEIGMTLSQADFEIPVFDTTVLHAKSALDFALS